MCFFCSKCNLNFNDSDIDNHTGHKLYEENLANVLSKSGLILQDQVVEKTKKSKYSIAVEINVTMITHTKASIVKE